MSWLGLTDQLAVVTGAAGGIGSRIAVALAGAGCRMVLIDLDQARCAPLAAEIAALGRPCLTLAADIADPVAVAQAAAASLAELGPCDILVNTPAVSGRPDAIMDVSPGKWQRQVAVNLNGYLYCAQQFGRQMQTAGGGSMVHIGSISGHHPQPRSGAYSITKAGVAMLSRALALELAPHRIRSNLVCPAMIRTPLSECLYADADLRALREAFAPLGRIGVPEEIADAVLFLASPRSAYVTGQDLLVDGGIGPTVVQSFPNPKT